MTRIAASEAIDRARRSLGGPSQVVEGEAAFVLRLDGAPDYYLVTLSEESRVTAAVIIDSKTGDNRESAKIANGRSPLQLPAERAAQLSGVQRMTVVELVWRPCRATRSPFYPVWRITGERVAYVDQQGKVWQDLE